MTGHFKTLGQLPRSTAASRFVVCFIAAGFACSAAAQAPPPAPAPQQSAPFASPPSVAAPRLDAPSAPAPPPAARRPGFLEVFGRWIDESVAGMGKGFGSAWGPRTATAPADAPPAAERPSGDVATSMVKGAADVAKGTADALGRLGTSRIISGRAVCVTAPNGAPDCRVAAETLCKANGFNTGSSVDYVTAEKCPAQAYQGGRMPAAGECPLEHVVTRALCQ